VPKVINELLGYCCLEGRGRLRRPDPKSSALAAPVRLRASMKMIPMAAATVPGRILPDVDTVLALA
jgi:hypothetical protein